ncbi:hypothetical protein MRX96_040930 [Rhipicephalus microplus]
MGRKSREILRSLNVNVEEMEDFNLVKSKFNDYFVHTKNIVYESARFNLRRQQLGETVDQFATELSELANRCEFAGMKERLVRDRFVVGLRDQVLSEELQMNPKLTMATALARALIVPDHFTRETSVQRKKETCRFCRKLGHYEKACRKKKQRETNLDSITEADGKFIGTVEKCANTQSEHFVTVKINDQTLRMKVDTGAEVTVVGENYPFLPPSLEHAADIKGPSNTSIRTIGKFDAKIS